MEILRSVQGLHFDIAAARPHMAVHRLGNIKAERDRKIVPPAAVPIMLLTCGSDQLVAVHHYLEIVLLAKPFLDLLLAYPSHQAIVSIYIYLHPGITRSLPIYSDIPAGRLRLYLFHTITGKCFL